MLSPRAREALSGADPSLLHSILKHNSIDPYQLAVAKQIAYKHSGERKVPEQDGKEINDGAKTGVAVSNEGTACKIGLDREGERAAVGWWVVGEGDCLPHLPPPTIDERPYGARICIPLTSPSVRMAIAGHRRESEAEL
ncbi:hypothetical protein J6590_049618 [Homalodisca vitripennis]|nr:hypothetical protein J6590_049618 [Homalodisca vitripennis]